MFLGTYLHFFSPYICFLVLASIKFKYKRFSKKKKKKKKKKKFKYKKSDILFRIFR